MDGPCNPDKIVRVVILCLV